MPHNLDKIKAHAQKLVEMIDNELSEYEESNEVEESEHKDMRYI